jgi:geranyl diphosphate synthase
VLEKNPSSSASANTNGRNGGLRQKSKYENILVPDPFSLVQKELQFIADRMRVAVQTDLPALANAAEYFFKYGAEGKRMRPTVLLLMASALSPVSNSGDVVRGGGGDVGRRMSSGDAFSSSSFRSSRNSAEEETVDLSPAHEVPSDNRQRQRRLAEITELIHVASLLHDDVLDGSATRRGLRALNLEVGNKLAILAGDFLLARASVTLASLRNVEVIELLSRVLEHLVKGEVMQMTQAKDEDERSGSGSSSSSSSSLFFFVVVYRAVH